LTWTKGVSGNPNGRPKDSTSINQLLKQVPVSKKAELVRTAYEFAIAGNVQWGEWIAKHSGEGAAFSAVVLNSGPWMEMQNQILESLGLVPQLIEGESEVIDSLSAADDTTMQLEYAIEGMEHASTPSAHADNPSDTSASELPPDNGSTTQ
jgi:hypothetical protein